MDSALSPREIQERIRSGESVDDLVRVAGIERDRVERFAAPVIAERDHVARLAMSSSARRRGETSAHRTLQTALREWLQARGGSIHAVSWDSWRTADGRWAVTADYQLGERPRQALFYFDLPGRFSVAGNDEGRRVLGDLPRIRPSEPSTADSDSDPTVDLSDELALVRAVQDFPAESAAAAGSGSSGEADRPPAEEPGQAEVLDLAILRQELQAIADQVLETDWEDTAPPVAGPAPEQENAGLATLAEIFADQNPETGTAGEPAGAEAATNEQADEAGLDEAGLDEAGLESQSADDAGSANDAAAVPELGRALRPEDWEPAIVLDYPVEPGEDSDAADTDIEIGEASDDPGRPEPPVARQDRRDEAVALEHELESADDQPPPDAAPDRGREPAEPDDPPEPGDQALPIDIPEQVGQPPARPARRKRAAVPSWDEIVFGGPKPTT